MNSDVSAHPYSVAFLAGDHAYVSGALSVDASGPVAGRKEALAAALCTLQDRLSSVNASLDQVVKTTYYVTDITLRDEANLQYLQVFSSPRPARTFVEVSRLPYGATVEIEAVAYLGERTERLHERLPAAPPSDDQDEKE